MEQQRQRMRLGARVLVGLAALTALEYVLAVTLNAALVYLIPLALAKAWLIASYFMHARQLWQQEAR